MLLAVECGSFTKFNKFSVNTFITHFHNKWHNQSINQSIICRYDYILRTLQPYGYEVQRHGELSADLVNHYGLLPIPSDKGVSEYFTPQNCDLLQEIVERVAHDSEKADVLILMQCLACLASEDGKPMFTWWRATWGNQNLPRTTWILWYLTANWYTGFHRNARLWHLAPITCS